MKKPRDMECRGAGVASRRLQVGVWLCVAVGSGVSLRVDISVPQTAQHAWLAKNTGTRE